MAMIAEVALAPIDVERGLSVLGAAKGELAHFSAHLPLLEVTAQPAAQRPFRKRSRSASARGGGCDTPRGSASVGQERFRPTIQRAQPLVRIQTHERDHLRDLVRGEQVALDEY